MKNKSLQVLKKGMVIKMDFLKELNNYLDDQGKLKLFPAKKKYKILSLMYLSTKFESGIIYTEKEVNEIIENSHTFQDKWLLRRELIDKGFMERLRDGSKYWLKENQPVFEDFKLD